MRRSMQGNLGLFAVAVLVVAVVLYFVFGIAAVIGVLVACVLLTLFSGRRRRRTGSRT